MFEVRYVLPSSKQIRYVNVTVEPLLKYLKEHKEHKIILLSITDDIRSYNFESWLQNLIL